jgi:uncharacterized protein YegJ (DUF2314 family)
MGNVRNICAECAKKRRKIIQLNIKERVSDLIDRRKAFSVKSSFTEDDFTEHMWINVYCISSIDRTISGTLSSTPLYIKSIKRGQKVTIGFNDVEDIVAWNKNKINDDIKKLIKKH